MRRDADPFRRMRAAHTGAGPAPRGCAEAPAQRLVRGGHPSVVPESAPYFRDIQDHLNRIEDDLEVCRETMDSVRDAFLALADVRINHVMKILTIVFTLSIPFTILTGWFGMNFKAESMPLSQHDYGIWIYTGLMFAMLGAMLVWLRAKRWI